MKPAKARSTCLCITSHKSGGLGARTNPAPSPTSCGRSTPITHRPPTLRAFPTVWTDRWHGDGTRTGPKQQHASRQPSPLRPQRRHYSSSPYCWTRPRRHRPTARRGPPSTCGRACADRPTPAAPSDGRHSCPLPATCPRAARQTCPPALDRRPGAPTDNIRHAAWKHRRSVLGESSGPWDMPTTLAPTPRNR